MEIYIFELCIFIFIFGYAGSSLLCAGFSSCGEERPLFFMVCGFPCFRAQAPGTRPSKVVAPQAPKLL